MSFINRVKFLLGLKESQARIAYSVNQIGNPVMPAANFDTFTKQGYQNNVAVYRCISMIARACAGIEWELYLKRNGSKPTELENHDLIKLFNSPNPLQARATFIESVVAYYFLTGNTYVEVNRPDMKRPPTELWTVKPNNISIVPNSLGYPAKYVLKANQVTREWPVDFVTMQGNLLHVKSFNPNDLWFGLSPLEAAMISLSQNNQIQRWNLSMLQNNATPSGVLKVKSSDSNPNGSLTEEQFTRLQGEMNEKYMGARNAGRPMLLEGNLEWQSISLSPKDMDFIKNKEVTAIDICQVFGVPPEMLGLGQKTFNNYEQARLAFYEETVLPMMDILQTEFNKWLVPMFEKNATSYELKYDKDDIEALAVKRESKYTMVKDLTFLTQNEKREACGYEPKDGWDVFNINGQLISSPDDVMEDINEEEPATDAPPAPAIEPRQEDIAEEIEPESDEEGKGWKSINLLNQSEKQTAWKRANWRRKRIEGNFSRDLISDFKAMGSDFKKAIKSSKEPRVIEFALSKAVDANMGDIKKSIERHIKYAAEDFGKNIFQNAKSIWPDIEKKSERQWNDWALRYIKSRSADAARLIEGTTRKQINRIMQEIEAAVIDGKDLDQIADEISSNFSTIGKSRAYTIARTETAAASNNASLEAVKSLKVPDMFKEWVSSEDDRVRGSKPSDEADHVAMNGVEIPIDDKFTVPPDATMESPCDPTADASQIVNCRCTLVFKSKGGQLGDEGDDEG
jgi:HK97 family phage portal protein